MFVVSLSVYMIVLGGFAVRQECPDSIFFFCFFLLGENQRDEGLALHHLKNTASPESKYKILLTLITLFFV